MFALLRNIYVRTLRLSGHRHAEWALAGVSFTESSFFPVPPDVMLVPMILAARAKAWRYALICTLASVLGALLGYAIGQVFWEAIGQPIVAFYNGSAAFDRFTHFYDRWYAKSGYVPLEAILFRACRSREYEDRGSTW